MNTSTQSKLKKLKSLSPAGLQGFLDYAKRHNLKDLEKLAVQVQNH